MTKEAGRELDAEVAEKVMGRRVERRDGEMYWPNDNDELFGTVQIPFFSTDISAAWQVVEKMKELGEGVSVLWLPATESHPDGWDACVLSDTTKSVIVHADTVPLAICLAALKAVA